MKKTALLLGIIIFIMAGVAGATSTFQSVAPISGTGYHINSGDSYSYAFDTPLSFSTPDDTLFSAYLVLTGTPETRIGSSNVWVGDADFGALNPIFSSGGFNTYFYNLTSLFAAWTGGNDNLPLQIYLDPHGNSAGFTLSSAVVNIVYSESESLNRTVDPGASPVPEPATLLLLGSALAGFSFWGKKRIKV